MKKLDMRIQRNNNLNDVYIGENEQYIQNGVPHLYQIRDKQNASMGNILFQKGPRKEPNSLHGVLEGDLLEIVRHRLQCHQNTVYATKENALALTVVEEALMWLNKRQEDRFERGVLGTTQK